MGLTNPTYRATVTLYKDEFDALRSRVTDLEHKNEVLERNLRQIQRLATDLIRELKP